MIRICISCYFIYMSVKMNMDILMSQNELNSMSLHEFLVVLGVPSFFTMICLVLLKFYT